MKAALLFTLALLSQTVFAQSPQREITCDVTGGYFLKHSAKAGDFQHVDLGQRFHFGPNKWDTDLELKPKSRKGTTTIYSGKGILTSLDVVNNSTGHATGEIEVQLKVAVDENGTLNAKMFVTWIPIKESASVLAKKGTWNDAEMDRGYADASVESALMKSVIKNKKHGVTLGDSPSMPIGKKVFSGVEAMCQAL